MRKVTFLVSLALLCCMVASCGSGSKASSTTPVSQTTPVSTDPASDPDPKPNGSITISGTVTFDRVGHLSNGGLDYSNIEQKPIRAVIVQLLHSDGSVVGQTMTDDSGRFDISASPNISVKIRVLAQLLKVGTPSWNFMVTDNTRGNALYALDGDLFNSGSEDMTRDLHASSGWGGNDYVGPRAAAPFAILDSIYSAVQLLLSADANVVIPSSEIRWSENNKPVSGDWDRGQIGTSFYEPRDRALYILGDKNNDTDEYDESVIQHEFAHFFEDSLSRTDSIGGAHSITSRLDPRVAFSEGLANAFAGMLSETASYSDSSGSKQASGFIFKLEESTVGSEGWYSENSVGQMVYDVFDSDNDGADDLSLGFSPIYQALTSKDFVDSSALTTIYLFSDVLNGVVDSEAQTSIRTLLEGERIFGTGSFGVGETNNGGVSVSLPLYTVLSVGSSVSICSTNIEGEGNALGVRRFVRINIPSEGTYTISLSKTSGEGTRDPDAILMEVGAKVIKRMFSAEADFESSATTFAAGDYILEVYDDKNNDNDSSTGGIVCFDVSLN